MPPGSRHDSPDELKRGSFHLLPDYGIILPSTRATFCHCRAQSDASGEKIGRSAIAIRNVLSGCWKRGFAREKPYSRFYSSLFTD